MESPFPIYGEPILEWPTYASGNRSEAPASSSFSLIDTTDDEIAAFLGQVCLRLDDHAEGTRVTNANIPHSRERATD